MKKHSNTTKSDLTTFNSSALTRLIRSAFTAALLPALLLLLTIQSSHAGSATWNLNPTGSGWNDPTDWTPQTVPNGPNDIATFDVSNGTYLSPSAPVTVNSIVFNAGASAYTFQPYLAVLTISGVGITNNSGIEQAFDMPSAAGLIFRNSATAGTGTIFSVTTIGGSFPSVEFFDSSTAGSGTFYANQSCHVEFFNRSTAGSGSFNNNTGFIGYGGGYTDFFNRSTAGDGTFINEGGTAGTVGGGPGVTSFDETSSAGNATLVANSGDPGVPGGKILFSGDSTGGTARVEAFGNGNLDISPHNSPGVTIGSLEGNGDVLLGANKLVVGTNNLSTIFSGVIADGTVGIGGSLSKSGRGKLTLSKESTYTGGTTVSKGTLLVTNRTGSATGTGAVAVNGGALGGTGTMSGGVTIATATRPAILAPGNGARPGTLTTASALVFDSLATFKVDLNSNTVTADQVVANGVTINSGAVISIADLGSGTLAGGSVFTVISNTAATPIAGTFSNLADGSTLIVGSNNFQVSYEGGTGNDLTLTVVP